MLMFRYLLRLFSDEESMTYKKSCSNENFNKIENFYHYKAALRNLFVEVKLLIQYASFREDFKMLTYCTEV
ncbi:hypothetical protein T4D_15680 [Trichinella pseudospiralis]|uniref:Uncharacterized protein n=1 Tax=Trichinella pseudospiralis TaxID=6337 RepID=A0A0V1FHK2_TRIPS|nr:hypothetical protein T4D_15680 [Trichinella pseudospiralis]